MAALRRSARSMFDVSGSVPQAMLAARERSRPTGDSATSDRFWLTLMLVALCQLADLVTFNLAVERFGPAGELGPLGMVYRIGGFAAVAIVKLGLIAGVMTVLARYPWRRVATRRRIALIVAGIGAFGAFTNVLAFGLLS